MNSVVRIFYCNKLVNIEASEQSFVSLLFTFLMLSLLLFTAGAVRRDASTKMNSFDVDGVVRWYILPAESLLSWTKVQCV